MFSQFSPPSREICTRPSSEPAQYTPGSWGDSTKANIVPKFSTKVVSFVIGPPEGSIFERSLRVRSGLIGSQLCPSFVERNTTSAATYSVPESCGEKTMGYVHWKRYLWSSTPWP